jgi:hypothetical protein
MKKKGKEVGPASVYAKPHTGSSPTVDLSSAGYGKNPQRSKVEDVDMSVASISGKPYKEPKTTGIKTRGNGAATKGTMARGPMA